MRTALGLIGTIALVYLAIVALVFVFQGRLLYLPGVGGRLPAATPAAVGLEFEDLMLPTADGEAIHGWFVPSEGARLTLVYFHGNAGNIGHRLDSIRLWHAAGISVLIFDYRGYGRSQGRPSEAATYRDAQAVWEYLTETRGLAPDRIVLYGRSLGGAVATWLAARETPAGLIIDSGFTSVPDLASEIYPWLPVRWLSRFDYDAEDLIARVRCPVLIIHGRHDEISPFRHGQALYAAAPEPKRFIETAARHNDRLLLADPRYRPEVAAFLNSL